MDRLELLEKAIENCYDGIFIVDKDGVVLFVNKAYEMMTKKSASCFVNHNMEQLLRDGIIDTYISRDVIRTGEAITANERLLSGVDVMITGKPIFGIDGKVVAAVTNVRDMSRIIELEEENKRFQEDILKNLKKDNVVATSMEMKNLLKNAEKIAKRDSTVLITGETGTGKEVIANHIYTQSARAGKPFIKINCGAISATLIESELFGYVKGAFTGANDKGKMGAFELADKGTLFLDEIGELPLDMQVKFLRVLQEGEITRIGAEQGRKIDVRIIAATNCNLMQMVENGTFREDLFYRISVLTLHVKPLRERREDISDLALLFIKKLNETYGEDKSITLQFLETLQNKPWPGNVRELSNYIEQQYVIHDGKVLHKPVSLDSRETDFDLYEQAILEKTDANIELPMLEDAVESVEKELILKAFSRAGNTYKAAELLGISQPTFSRKYSKYKQTV